MKEVRQEIKDTGFDQEPNQRANIPTIRANIPTIKE